VKFLSDVIVLPKTFKTQPMAGYFCQLCQDHPLYSQGNVCLWTVKVIIFFPSPLSLSLSDGLEPPGPIDNSKIAVMKGGHIQLKQGIACPEIDVSVIHLVSKLCVTSMCVFVYSSLSTVWFAGADYGQISEETWQYLLSIYGGGPEIAVRQTISPPDTDTHGERKIEAETRAL